MEDSVAFKLAHHNRWPHSHYWNTTQKCSLSSHTSYSLCYYEASFSVKEFISWTCITAGSKIWFPSSQTITRIGLYCTFFMSMIHSYSISGWFIIYTFIGIPDPLSDNSSTVLLSFNFHRACSLLASVFYSHILQDKINALYFLSLQFTVVILFFRVKICIISIII